MPYLQRFVYTSEAPRELVEAWAPLGNSTSTTAGQLSDVRFWAGAGHVVAGYCGRVGGRKDRPAAARFPGASQRVRPMHPSSPPTPTHPTNERCARVQLVDAVAGEEEVLRVVCVGEGAAGGGLATLCGPWAALQYPKANADVITFQAPWVSSSSSAWPAGGWGGGALRPHGHPLPPPTAARSQPRQCAASSHNQPSAPLPTTDT